MNRYDSKVKSVGSISLLVQEFEHSEVRIWMEDNWQVVCRWASGVYLLMIFGGQYLMAKR